MDKKTIYPKRKITPHKGGRTKRLPTGWCTPDELEKIKKVLAKTKLSFSDYAIHYIDDDSHKLDKEFDCFGQYQGGHRHACHPYSDCVFVNLCKKKEFEDQQLFELGY